jgi:hypothetical protein
MSMYVQKRDGRKESVHFDKITSRISKLCYGLDSKVRTLPKPFDALANRVEHWFLECDVSCRCKSPHTMHQLAQSLTHSLTHSLFLSQHVDAVVISQKVIQGVYPGVTTTELDE